MRIGIDISAALPPRTGVGNYTLRLVNALLALPECRAIQFNLLLKSFRRGAANLPLEPHPAARVRRCRMIPGPWLLRAWQACEWPRIETLCGRNELFHSPAAEVPPQRFGRRVTTVHDLWFLKHPEHCDRLGGQYLRRRLDKVIRQLDAVIAVSEFTRREILEHYKLPPERIFRVYNGVDARFFQPAPAPAEGLRGADGQPLPAEYLLSVSTLEPRKNFPGLLAAYELACSRNPDMPPLVLTGMYPACGAGARELRAALERSRIRERVYFTGYAGDETLPALYQRAALFVLPSFCEGFGLPVLEALAAGAPVACSAGSALDETGGAAVWRFDAEQPESIAETMLAALTDSAERRRRAELGRAHAAQFSWRRCAEETFAVYQQALKN